MNALQAAVARAIAAAKYSPDQERDDHGRWTSEGGGGSPGEPAGHPASTFARLAPDQAELLAGMYQQAAEDKSGFDRLIHETADAVGGDGRTVPLKSADRAAEKAAKDYNGDASKVTDILRASVVAPNGAAMDRAAEMVRENFHVLREINRVDNPGPDGYRDILFKVRTASGHVAEVQVQVPQMMGAKLAAHALYEQRESIFRASNGNRLSTADFARVQSLNAEMRVYYTRAWATATKSSHAAAEIIDPLRIAEANGNGRGGSVSKARQCTSSPFGTNATGVPSTSRNSVAAGNAAEGLLASAIRRTSEAILSDDVRKSESKYSPDEPRDDHGRWTSDGGGDGTTAQGLSEHLAREGGFTYQPVTQSMPKEGYALSILPGHEAVFERDVTAEDVRAYMEQHAAALQNPNAHFGAWRDPTSGKVYFDISIVEPDRARAVSLGKTHGQISIFNLGTGETVYLKEGSGKAGTHAIPEGLDSAADRGLHQRAPPRENQHVKYSEDQARDDHGRWTDGGGDGHGRWTDGGGDGGGDGSNVAAGAPAQLVDVTAKNQKKLGAQAKELRAQARDDFATAPPSKEDEALRRLHAAQYIDEVANADPKYFGKNGFNRVALNANGKIVGAISVRETMDNAGYIYHLGALEHGVGAQLMDSLMSHAKAVGWRALALESTPKAQSFYKRMGFKLTNAERRTYVMRLKKKQAEPGDEPEAPCAFTAMPQSMYDRLMQMDEGIDWSKVDVVPDPPDTLGDEALKFRADQARDEHGRWTLDSWGDVAAGAEHRVSIETAGGHAEVEVVVDPSREQFARWTGNGQDIKEVRGVSWKGRTAWWDAYESSHGQMIDALSTAGTGMPPYSDWSFHDRIAQVHEARSRDILADWEHRLSPPSRRSAEPPEQKANTEPAHVDAMCAACNQAAQAAGRDPAEIEYRSDTLTTDIEGQACPHCGMADPESGTLAVWPHHLDSADSARNVMTALHDHMAMHDKASPRMLWVGDENLYVWDMPGGYRQIINPRTRRTIIVSPYHDYSADNPTDPYMELARTRVHRTKVRRAWGGTC